MQVRPLLPSDRSQWEPLWQAYLEFYEHAVASSVTARTFERLVGDDPAMSGFVAADGYQLVGLCHVVLHPSTWTEGPYCYLEDLFVRPDRRLAGTGRALISAASDAARRAGATVARRLYDSVAEHRGFLVYETELGD